MTAHCGNGSRRGCGNAAATVSAAQRLYGGQRRIGRPRRRNPQHGAVEPPDARALAIFGTVGRREFFQKGRCRLDVPLALTYGDCDVRGLVAEWLRRGLQILAPRFDSGRGLHSLGRPGGRCFSVMSGNSVAIAGYLLPSGAKFRPGLRARQNMRQKGPSGA